MSRKRKNRTLRGESGADPSKAVEIAREADYSTGAALVDCHLPVLFVALGLLMGTLYAFLMPPMQIADEMMHFARAYSVSRGVCLASPDIDMPRSFARLSDLFPHWLERSRKISTEDLRQALKIPLNDHDMAGDGRQRSLEGFINQNVYHCVPNCRKPWS